jgi:hypothetical protein
MLMMGLRHGGAGLNGFGIGLEVTLSGDQVNQLLGQVNVRALCGTSADGSETAPPAVPRIGLPDAAEDKKLESPI